MTVEELIIYGKKFLHSIEVKMLLARVLECDTLNLINILNEKVEENKVNLFKDLIKARLDNKPLQYILGTTNFYGLELIVNKNVLIPRFETEELVENTKKIIETKFKDISKIKILDLCCGSGAIGLALKNLFPEIDVTMSDISRSALEVAKQNSAKLNLKSEIIESNLFENIKEKYNIIVSNPPYIKVGEEIEDIVKNNEPPLALYAGEDGLYYYRKILENIKDYLEDDFLIAFEIGYDQKEKIIKLLKENLKNVNIITKKDLSDKDRMIFITNI